MLFSPTDLGEALIGAYDRMGLKAVYECAPPSLLASAPEIRCRRASSADMLHSPRHLHGSSARTLTSTPCLCWLVGRCEGVHLGEALRRPGCRR